MQARRLLNNFFSCHSKIDILRTVVGSDEPQSGRKIASKAGLSPRSCQLSLDELVRLNVLRRRSSGKAYYYSVNIDNRIVTDLIIPIFQQEERLTDQVVEKIRMQLRTSRNGVLGIYFLESWPRSWGKKGAGALILSVLSDGKTNGAMASRLEELRDQLLSCFGMPIDYVILTIEEFAELARKSPGDLDRIGARLRNLAGRKFDELVRSERGSPEHIRRATDFFPKRRKGGERR